MASNANDFLDKTMGDVKEPPVLPEGEYIFRITSYLPGHRKNEKETPFVRFNLKPLESVDGSIDAAKLATYKKVEYEFPMTDAAQPIAKRFLTKELGINSDDATPFRQLFEEALGLTFRAITKVELVGKNKDIEIARVVKVIKNAEAA